jgi:outer membrane protein assembly factor BamB
MLTITATIVALPIANAHTPAWNVPTYAYITVGPNPVGVNQPVTLVYWLEWIPPTASGAGGDRWRGWTIEVTEPDETKQTITLSPSDPVGGGYYLYTPDQVGTYTFNFSFPGQILSRTGPTGIVGSTSAYEGDTFQASSATATLTVQQEPIPPVPSYPLPTEYWSRPIEGQNTNWWTISSNWLAGSHIVDSFQQDGTAPNSAHVMWTKPIESGGVVGGSRTYINGATFYDGTAYEGKFTGPIIMCGRLYYNLPRSDVGSGGGYACVDLRTGEEIYWQNMTAPSFGQLYYYESMNQHGVVPNGYLWRTASAAGVTTWMAYDPLDGNLLFNETNVPSGTTIYGPNGEILIYQMNYAARWLALWNNTCEQQGLHGALGTGSSAFQWRPVGKTVNMSKAYSWNVTIPDLPGKATPTIAKVIPDDLVLGRSTSFEGIGTWGTPDPWTMWAISLKPEKRGQLSWIKNYSAPAGNLTLYPGPVDPETRVFTMWQRDALVWSGYSIDNGTLLWTAKPEEDWGFYAHTWAVAYGKLYSAGLGIVYCYDLKDGRQLWNYSAPGGLAVPYPNYPLAVTTVADGKVYLGTIEHSRGAPYWKGAKLHCVNASTGDVIWTLDSASSSTAGGLGAITTGFALADGYFTYINLYDMQIYCVGKGPSATTVEAPMTAITAGESLVLRGRVTDISAGTKQHEQAARFPNGVPAMSDKSMGAWMEYVYMQKPLPNDATGVEVSLDTLDPNNNFIHIGTATSDTSGTFGYTWTPPDVPGDYTITATFAGSGSYWGSYAETHTVVSEAPAATAPPEYPQPIDPTLTIVGVGIAIIIAVAIATILILRKK